MQGSHHFLAALHRRRKALGTTYRAALRRIPAERVNEAALQLNYVPIVEGGLRTPMNLVWMQVPDNAVMMSDNFSAWGNDVPVIYSCYENEGRFFLDVTKDYGSSVLDVMNNKLVGPKADEAKRLLDAQGGTALEKLDRLYTIVVWSELAYASLRRFGRDSSRLYYYQFGRVAPGRIHSNRLASHGADVYYVFGNLIDEGPYDDLDRTISQEMQHAFVEFARSGVPKRPDGSRWPTFEAEE